MTTTITPTWSVSDRLVKARTFADLTQDEMAGRLGIGRRTVIRHERDETPPLAFVYSYAAATGVPVAWLLGDDRADLEIRCFREDGDLVALHDPNQRALFTLAA